mmetsp:Transcript_102709/g.268056  ORF Transcript_102709/g.268056 Transcript_102709/m.268056 type:complete len:220 (-) Transcript_102709:183-842(-)
MALFFTAFLIFGLALVLIVGLVAVCLFSFSLPFLLFGLLELLLPGPHLLFQLLEPLAGLHVSFVHPVVQVQVLLLLVRIHGAAHVADLVRFHLLGGLPGLFLGVFLDVLLEQLCLLQVVLLFFVLMVVHPLARFLEGLDFLLHLGYPGVHVRGQGPLPLPRLLAHPGLLSGDVAVALVDDVLEVLEGRGLAVLPVRLRLGVCLELLLHRLRMDPRAGLE